MLPAIQTNLSSFAPISLAEMDNVKLMDRTDTKYTFPYGRLTEILSLIQDKYSILVVEGVRINRYETLYFDTVDLLLYHLHHSGKLNRYKVRHRTYVESKIGFLEVKFKNNKGRTFKTRIKQNAVCYEFNEEQQQNFIHNKTPYQSSDLKPVIWVNYNRITLVNKTSAERLTIDLNLEFKRDGSSIIHHDLVIAEVKQDGKAYSPFIETMKKLHLREGSISKYCLGIALTYPNVKKNSFKPKIHSIKNLLNNDSTASS